MHSKVRSRAAGHIAIAVAACMGITPVTRAADPAPPAPIQFDIKPQPLAAALNTLALQSHQQILFTPEVTQGQTTQGVKGLLAPEAALSRLLVGTGLSYSKSAEGMILVSHADAKEASAPAGPRGAPNGATNDPSDAAALSPAGSQSPPHVEEIIVTAQKRSERLQDVPVPVTSISAAELTQSNQTRLQDYYATVPGLSISPSVESRQRVSIRGITTGGTTNPTVGVTVDGVPFGSSTEIGGSSVVPDVDPSDLARVEVLRGPQGTLYGASSMGGLINFVTVEPSTSALSGRLEAGTESVHNGAELGYALRGAANLPLTDTLAMRASSFVREDPGYIDNPIRGIDGVNKNTALGGHLSTLWQPAEDFSIKLSALLQQVRGDGALDVDKQPGLGDLQQNYPPGVGRYERRVQAYSATLKARFAGMDLTAVSGYNINGNNSSWDYTYALSSIIAPLYGVPATPVFENNSTGKFSQEVRLSGTTGWRLEWVVGGFYTDETSHYREDILAEDPTTGSEVGEFASLIFPTRYKEYAGFADLTYHFTDQFDVQIGGRESGIRQKFAETIAGLYDTVILKAQSSPVVYPSVDINANAFTYLITPRWRVTHDFMVYARVASGYRAGGGNAAAVGVTTVPREYAPDKTHNYELGAKVDLLDHRLSLDTSLYYIRWDDIQLPLRDPATRLSFTGNASQGKSEGIELSVEARPLEQLTISGWISWDDAVLTRPLPSTSTAIGNAGDRLPDTSKFSGSLSVLEQFPLGASLSGYVGSVVSYVGDRLGVFEGLSKGMPAPRQDLPGYVQTNFNAGLKYDSWTVNAYVNNAFDRRGLLDGGADLFPTYAYIYIQPRTIGVSVSKGF